MKAPTATPIKDNGAGLRLFSCLKPQPELVFRVRGLKRSWDITMRPRATVDELMRQTLKREGWNPIEAACVRGRLRTSDGKLLDPQTKLGALEVGDLTLVTRKRERSAAGCGCTVQACCELCQSSCSTAQSSVIFCNSVDIFEIR
jgi:hypothetical protein